MQTLGLKTTKTIFPLPLLVDQMREQHEGPVGSRLHAVGGVPPGIALVQAGAVHIYGAYVPCYERCIERIFKLLGISRSNSRIKWSFPLKSQTSLLPSRRSDGSGPVPLVRSLCNAGVSITLPPDISVVWCLRAEHSVLLPWSHLGLAWGELLDFRWCCHGQVLPGWLVGQDVRSV